MKAEFTAVRILAGKEDSMHKVFKLEAKGDVLHCAYLYSDGHVVCTFERRSDIGTLHYVKIAQDIGIRTGFQGRIVFHNPAFLVAIAGLPNAQINFRTPSLHNGSNKTKELGLLVAGLSVYSTVGYFNVSWPENVLSSGVTIQENNDEEFEPKRPYWSESKVVCTYLKTAA